jgi:hypothetical protein
MFPFIARAPGINLTHIKVSDISLAGITQCSGDRGDKSSETPQNGAIEMIN